MKDSYVEILQALLGQPTAPFHEQAVVDQVRLWSAGRGIDFSQDRAGNVVLRHRVGQPVLRWAFEAHLDHPGFQAVSTDGSLVRADFLGTVGESYFPGSRVRFFAPAGPVAGRIVGYCRADRAEWPVCEVELDSPAQVPAGTTGMWDLPDFELTADRLTSRACDDVVGCAAALAALEEIVACGQDADVTVLLARAEEVGGMGVIAAAEDGVLSGDSLVVGIETSKAQPRAALGDGVVVRVGDRVRTFDASLTAAVAAVADELARSDGDFRSVRQLMPGGSCESTIWCLWGYRATGVCLPLGNYHNQGDDGRIRAEQVHPGDFECLVKLLAALAGSTVTPEQRDRQAKARYEDLMRRRRKFL